MSEPLDGTARPAPPANPFEMYDRILGLIPVIEAEAEKYDAQAENLGGGVRDIAQALGDSGFRDSLRSMAQVRGDTQFEDFARMFAEYAGQFPIAADPLMQEVFGHFLNGTKWDYADAGQTALFGLYSTIHKLVGGDVRGAAEAAWRLAGHAQALEALPGAFQAEMRQLIEELTRRAALASHAAVERAATDAGVGLADLSGAFLNVPGFKLSERAEEAFAVWRHAVHAPEVPLLDAEATGSRPLDDKDWVEELSEAKSQPAETVEADPPTPATSGTCRRERLHATIHRHEAALTLRSADFRGHPLLTGRPGCTRCQLDRAMAEVRRLFARHGLEAWVERRGFEVASGDPAQDDPKTLVLAIWGKQDSEYDRRQLLPRLESLLCAWIMFKPKKPSTDYKRGSVAKSWVRVLEALVSSLRRASFPHKSAPEALQRLIRAAGDELTARHCDSHAARLVAELQGAGYTRADLERVLAERGPADVVRNALLDAGLRLWGAADPLPATQHPPAPTVVGGVALNDRHCAILDSLLDEDATHKRAKVTTTRLAALVDGPKGHGPNFKESVATLVKIGLAASCAGRAGGVWLTPAGARLAQSSRDAG